MRGFWDRFTGERGVGDTANFIDTMGGMNYTKNVVI